MQVIATGPYWVLLFLVPRKESSVEEVAATSPDSELKTEGEGTEQEAEPLLK